ncbi:MAG: hypothetical protein QXF61_02380 [Nitrososphaeria archaeon]
MFYPPSLGIDVWRDIGWANAIDKGISLPEFSAYPFPLIPILYLILSKIISLSTVDTSALIGLVYIELVFILVFALSRVFTRSTTSSSLVIILLTISNPLITRWSVHFIPQAYAVTLSLLIVLFTVKEFINSRSTLALTFLITLALVFSHAVVSILTAFLLLCVLVCVKFLQRRRTSRTHYQYVKSTVKFLLIVFLAYVIFTTLIEVLIRSAKDILSVLSKAVIGVEPQHASFKKVVESPPCTALLSYGSLVVCMVGVFFSWLENEPSGSIVATFTEGGLISAVPSLAVSMLGVIYSPELNLDRYLGLQALLILTVLSANGFNAILWRGKVGKAFVLTLTILLIAATIYGGTFTPDQGFLNKSNAYAVHAPINWNEKASMDSIVPYIKGLTAYADWRTSLFLIWFYECKSEVSIVTLGARDAQLSLLENGSIGISCGNSLKPIHPNSILIYRRSALTMLNSLKNLDENYLHHKLLDCAKVYCGPLEIFVF